MRRETMSNDRHEAEQASGKRTDIPASRSTIAGERPGSFDCCGTGMGEAMARCPCGPVMKRHPVITALVLSFAGLAALLVPAGAILGILAFLRTM